MHLLYTNLLPLRTQPGKESFVEYFKEAISKSDTVEIATGYVSRGAIIELAKYVEEYGISSISLVVGMYYHEGMPEGIYNALTELHEVWQAKGIGSVNIVRPFSYHGKVYAFFKDGQPIAGIVGSNNLGAIKLEASNLRQYEMAVATEDATEISEISSHIRDMMGRRCSFPINEITDMKLIRQQNNALIDQQFVDRVTPEDVDAYKEHCTDISFEIPLKVPANKEDDNMRGSNINVCYASGRKRVWWECEVVVGKAIRDLPGYPEWQKPFMAITDDGWKFQVWTCGQNNKNLYSKDDLKIMGRWIKGRLVAAGLVEPVNNVSNDPDCRGLITGETLARYGRDTITLTKTDQQTTTADGTPIDIWMLSFLPN